MGVMIDGTYHTNDPGPDTNEGGRFKRAEAKIRDWITPDGPYTPDPGRYHLYVAWNCPWAHRALLARAILGLDDAITVSYARPRRTDQGWVYDADGEYADPELEALSSGRKLLLRMGPENAARVRQVFREFRQHIVE